MHNARSKADRFEGYLNFADDQALSLLRQINDAAGSLPPKDFLTDSLHVTIQSHAYTVLKDLTSLVKDAQALVNTLSFDMRTMANYKPDRENQLAPRQEVLIRSKEHLLEICKGGPVAFADVRKQFADLLEQVSIIPLNINSAAHAFLDHQETIALKSAQRNVLGGGVVPHEALLEAEAARNGARLRTLKNNICKTESNIGAIDADIIRLHSEISSLFDASDLVQCQFDSKLMAIDKEATKCEVEMMGIAELQLREAMTYYNEASAEANEVADLNHVNASTFAALELQIQTETAIWASRLHSLEHQAQIVQHGVPDGCMPIALVAALSQAVDGIDTTNSLGQFVIVKGNHEIRLLPLSESVSAMASNKGFLLEHNREHVLVDLNLI